jgi:hypothetical protein
MVVKIIVIIITIVVRVSIIIREIKATIVIF